MTFRSVCATESCNEDCECARRLQKRVKDHNGHVHFCYLVKHAIETGHLPVETNSFEVIGTEYRNDTHTK